jgi:hypothetical protein
MLKCTNRHTGHYNQHYNSPEKQQEREASRNGWHAGGVGKSEAHYGGVAARGRASREGAITPVKWTAHRSDQKRFIYRLLTRHDCLLVWLVADE